MYQKDEHFNLFPSMDLSEDAKRLLTAWVVSNAGSGVINMGTRCGSKLGRVVFKATGLAGVLWGANELVDVLFDIDILGSAINAVSDSYTRFKENRENSNPDDPKVVDSDGHEI